MKSLDSKLREILFSHNWDQGVYELEGTDPEVVEAVIPEIKQAFADEFYEKMAFNPAFLDGLLEAAKEDGNLMTGQEWEQKALKEGWRRPDDK